MKVELIGLTKQFSGAARKDAPVTAINNIDLTLPDGKLVALLGPSGCGKSTTLNMISGLIDPTEGRILFDGEDVTDIPAEKRGVGMVFQNYALYPHMTVRQNIKFPLGNYKGKDKLTAEQMEERISSVAKLVQIEELLDRKPGELSGGQQQRVAIARALVKLPKVLLLDEPLSNLDARLRLQTREEIRRIQKKTGITTAFVTHDQDEAMSISDMIVVMKDGAVMQTGKPQSVYDDPCSLFVAKFLGTPPINVFDGEIHSGALYIGDDFITDTGLKDGKVTVGIRPEGFDPAKDGKLICDGDRIEVMGRDMIVLARNAASHEPIVRAIVSQEDDTSFTDGKIRFNIKPGKLYIFDNATGDRLRFERDGKDI